MAVFLKTPNNLSRELRQVLKKDKEEIDFLDETINLSSVSLLSDSKEDTIYKDICKENLNAAILIAQRDVKEKNEHYHLFNKELETDTASSYSSISDVPVKNWKPHKRTKKQHGKDYPASLKLLPARGMSPPTHDVDGSDVVHRQLFTHNNKLEITNHIKQINSFMESLPSFSLDKDFDEDEVEKNKRMSRLSGRATRIKRSIYDLQRGVGEFNHLKNHASDEVINKRLLLLCRNMNLLLRLVKVHLNDVSSPAHFIKSNTFKLICKLLGQIVSDSSTSLHLPREYISSILDILKKIAIMKQSGNVATVADTIVDENNNILPHLRAASYDVTTPRDDKDEAFKMDIIEMNKKRILADYLRSVVKDKDLGKENVFKGGLGDNKLKVKSNLNNRRLRQMNKNVRNIKLSGVDKFNRPTSTPASINRREVRVLSTNKNPSLKSCDEEKKTILMKGKSSESLIGQASKRSINRIPLRSQKSEKIININRNQDESKKNNLMYFEPENIYLKNDIKDGGGGDYDRDDNDEIDLRGVLGRMKQIEEEKKSIAGRWLKSEPTQLNNGNNMDQTSKTGHISNPICSHYYTFDGDGKSGDEEVKHHSRKSLHDKWIEKDKNFFESHKSQHREIEGSNNEEEEEEEKDDEWMAKVYEQYVDTCWSKLRGVLGDVNPLTLCDQMADNLLEELIGEVCGEVNGVGHDVVNKVCQNELHPKPGNSSS